MFSKIRAFLLSLTITAVLIFSAAGTTVVYADGGTPPESVTKTVKQAEPAEATKEKSGVPTVGTSVLETVPDNTAIAIVGADGELQPLAAHDSIQAIDSGDPIWCPAAVTTPTPGANGCTQTFSTFTALLTFLSGNSAYQGAGTIFVQQGANAGSGTIDFNKYDLSNLSTSDLTIAGGWNPSSGAIDPTTPSTFNNVSFIIGSSANPWGGSLFINNISITNPSGTGIVVYSNADISLNNVSVTNSTNGAGAELHAGNDVNINNSTFDRNKTAGAIIRAVADVSVANSSFSNPANARRQIVGLDIITDGTVSLLNVIANENREAGATIEAGGRVSISNSVFSGTKAISGSEFLGYGLKVTSGDAIDLNEVTANDNFLWGAWLITTSAAGNVNIANSIFNGNTTESPGFIDDTGLLVDSAAGVSLFNVEANNNRLIGATIDAVGDVSITDSDFSSNNGVLVDSAGNPTFYGYGLEVNTDGNIFLNGVTAMDNTLYGASLTAGQDVAISNSSFGTTAGSTDVQGFGAEIISGGNVLLDTVTFDGNLTFGASITAGAAVFLENVTATNNGTNGVEVQANCTSVFLINGTYSNNGEYGLSVIDGQLIQSGAPIFANNGSGNIFEDPGTCVFTATSTPPTAPGAPGADPIASILKQDVYGSGAGSNSTDESLVTKEMVTLNSFLAAGNGAPAGLFIGQYMYIDSSRGLHVVVFAPSA